MFLLPGLGRKYFFPSPLPQNNFSTYFYIFPPVQERIQEGEVGIFPCATAFISRRFPLNVYLYISRGNERERAPVGSLSDVTGPSCENRNGTQPRHRHMGRNLDCDIVQWDLSSLLLNSRVRTTLHIDIAGGNFAKFSSSKSNTRSEIEIQSNNTF